MISFTYDRNKIKLQCDNLDTIREHFSVKDDTARFRLKGRARFYANPRIYCITPTGLFEPGLFFNILTFIKTEFPDEDINVSSDILSIVKVTSAY